MEMIETRVLSLEQYKELTNQAKESGCRLTNCVLLADAVRQKILGQTLYYLQMDQGLLILDDQGGFYRCYFYLAENGDFERVELDKPAVIEMPYTKALTDKQVLQVALIQAMGFRLGRESGMMGCLPEELLPLQVPQKDLCAVAEDRDAAQINALLRANFDPLFAFLPSEEELDAVIREKRVFVIRDGKKVAAVLISGVERKAASVKQVAVDPAYRRKGFGTMLMKTYHARYRDEVASFQHWVDMKNSSAIEMYKHFGYQFGLRRANEYVLTEKENRS